MNFNNFLFRDTSGKKSTTLTAFVLGFLAVNLKLLFAGMELFGTTFSEFSGTDYAAAMAALGAIYVMRRSTDPELKEKVRRMTDQEGGE